MLSPGRSVSITPRLVILVSIGGALGGALLYEITKRLSSDPVQKFRLAAFLILIASFSAPLAIDTFTRALTIVLDVMHVVVYAATVWALTVWSPREPLRASA
jgi:fluoride ion exporter CrcB/FEX